MTEDREQLGGGEGFSAGLDEQPLADNAAAADQFDLGGYERAKRFPSSVFNSGLRIAISSVNFCLSADRRNFNIEPVYRIKTSKGVDLAMMVTSGSFENTKGLIPVKDGPICIYRLLAMDESGEIVGLEKLEIKIEGNGLDVPRVLAASLREAEVEQERWQSVWGDEGRYGFKNNFRVFTPDERRAGVDREAIEFIDLEKIETVWDGKTFVTALGMERVVVPAEKGLLKRRRSAELHILLERYNWVHYVD